jgi:hypothetical protein
VPDVAQHVVKVAANESQGEDCDDRDKREDKSVFNEALTRIPAPATKDQPEMPRVHCRMLASELRFIVRFMS